MKVLVISHNCFSRIYNNGKTLSAICSAFDKKELCQLYFTPQGEPYYDRCEDYYLITDKNALKSIFCRTKCGKIINSNNLLYKKSENISSSHSKQTSLKLLLRSLMWQFSAWCTRDLKEWLFNQKPEIIFYVGGNSVFSHKVAIEISKMLNIPLATYFTDDYVINPSTTLYIKWLKKQYRNTINHPSLLFAIGEQMAHD